MTTEALPIWIRPFTANRDELVTTVTRIVEPLKLSASRKERAIELNLDTIVLVARMNTGDDRINLHWVAACLGHAQSCMEIARALATIASERWPDQKETLPDRVMDWLTRAGQTASPPAMPQAPGKLGKPILPPSGFVPMPQPSHAAPSFGDDEDENEEAAREPASGVVVVKEIGDAGSREGSEVRRRYHHIINRKVPFAGAIPTDFEVQLEKTFPWMPEVVRFLAGRIALLNYTDSERLRLTPVLLVGPPGCGKTFILEWLFRVMGMPFLTIPCGGTADAGGLAPVARGWSAMRVSAPVQLIADNHSANPGIILDEIEKGTDVGGQNGSVVGSVISMMSNTQGFYDSCLMAPVDISHVSFMATANSLEGLPVSLLDRFKIYRVGRPKPEHFPILLNSVRQSEARNLGVEAHQLPKLSDHDVDWLFSAWKEAGRSIRALQSAHGLLVGELAREQAHEQAAERAQDKPRMLH